MENREGMERGEELGRGGGEGGEIEKGRETQGEGRKKEPE